MVNKVALLKCKFCHGVSAYSYQTNRNREKIKSCIYCSRGIPINPDTIVNGHKTKVV